MRFKRKGKLSTNLVAANVSSLICFYQKIRADSRRLLPSVVQGFNAVQKEREAVHKLRSSEREFAHLLFSEDQSRLTSAATRRGSGSECGSKGKGSSPRTRSSERKFAHLLLSEDQSRLTSAATRRVSGS